MNLTKPSPPIVRPNYQGVIDYRLTNSGLNGPRRGFQFLLREDIGLHFKFRNFKSGDDMIYDIVNVKLTHPSFKWSNGLYAVIERTENDLKLCRINEDGKPYTYEDGRFSIGVTSVNNKEVYPTGLKLNFQPTNQRYPMCEDQPAQIDCRVSSCRYYGGSGKCTNISPALTLNEHGTFVCWTQNQETI